MDRISPRQIMPTARQPSRSSHRQQQSKRTTRRTDDQRLCHLLANQSSSPSAQRPPNRRLFLSCSRPGHEQIRNIQAPNQQHANNRARHHHQRRLHIMHNIIQQRPCISIFRNRRTQPLHMHLILQRAYRRHRTLQANVRPHSSNNPAPVAIVTFPAPAASSPMHTAPTIAPATPDK